MAASLFLRVVAVALILFSTITYAYSTAVAVKRQTVQALEGYVVDVYWEVSTPNTGYFSFCTPQPGTLSETYPPSGGYLYYNLLPYQVTCVASPIFSSTQTFSGGTCLLVVFMFFTGPATLYFLLNVLPSGQFIGLGYFTVSGSSFGITEYVVSFTCESFAVQAGQYIELELFLVSAYQAYVFSAKLILRMCS